MADRQERYANLLGRAAMDVRVTCRAIFRKHCSRRPWRA